MANDSCYASTSVGLPNALLTHSPAASLILATSAWWNSMTHRKRWSTVLKVNILILCHMILKFLSERNQPGLKGKKLPTATVSCLLTKMSRFCKGMVSQRNLLFRAIKQQYATFLFQYSEKTTIKGCTMGK